MNDYYVDTLAAENLKKCYEIAPARTRQYLREEINHVITHISEDAAVLELGCGYGRVLAQLVNHCATLVGIDTSFASLRMSYSYLARTHTIEFSQMNANHLGYSDSTFDVIVCIQNGISAFRIDPKDLILEAYRVVKPGGICLFSSYSPKFWKSRLEWFCVQAEIGLIGEIDWNLTQEGNIVCKDGFRATTYDTEKFKTLLNILGLKGTIVEVDESSLFCEIRKHPKVPQASQLYP